ncbi:MAG: RNA methyltransferase [Phycisphaerales bacterium]|nr:RNA methyltransferase [Phycisphaerales bacterium]
MSPPIPVSTFDDPRIDVYRNVRDADLRGRQHLFLAESEVVLRRLLRMQWPLHSIFVSPRKYERLAGVFADSPMDAPVYVADLALMTRIVGFRVHRGALAAVHRPAPADLSLDNLIDQLRDQKQVTLLLAEGITNVDNMGAIFRNAAAFGVDGVVLDGTCCDPLYRKAIRVSVGQVLSMQWAVAEDWGSAIDRIRTELNLTIIGCESGQGGCAMRDVPHAPRMAIAVGAEETGLSATTLQRCDAIAEIPMSGSVPSINVAVASAVALYEFQRRC